VEGLGGENPWPQFGPELQSAVTNADEAAGLRHQPAFLFLLVQDMKGGGCSTMRLCEECGKLPYRLAGKRSKRSSGNTGIILMLGMQIMLHN
jgi:hypothetical protein